MLASTEYEITEAENGDEALAVIAKQRPDLILMDIQLPIMDGYTATRRIKSDPALRAISIIAVTSYALSGEEKKARAAGCDDLCAETFQSAPTAGENSPVPAIVAGTMLRCTANASNATPGRANFARWRRRPLNNFRRAL
jgi:two-component system cell cycle response regulator DivK